MRELPTHELVGILINAATGERWGDGYTVTDVIDGYAEPGYHPSDTLVVLGNWNPKRWPRDGGAPLTKAETIGPRLADALDKLDGVDIQWLDEWHSCNGCYRAVRTEPNSYSWQPAYAWMDGCEIYCHDCLKADIATSLENGDYINNPRMAITWLSDAELEQAGWTQWEPADPHTYESGWHPGQTDDPEKVLEAIRRETAADVVFRIHENSQFYTRWRAYTRDDVDDDVNDVDEMWSDEEETMEPTDERTHDV